MPSSNKILISACLLGQPVRFDGKSKHYPHPLLTLLQQQHRLLPFCPECAGGLATPRAAAEIQADRRVTTLTGTDVTIAFKQGADLALNTCIQHNIKIAILKANSPSCSNEFIYNGQFNKTLINGVGITTETLSQNGIRVFNEHQLDHLAALLSVPLPKNS